VLEEPSVEVKFCGYFDQIMLQLRYLKRAQGSKRLLSTLDEQVAKSFGQYPFLERLGLSATSSNLGVWTGKSWQGSGEEGYSFSPATGEAIAKVTHGTEKDYEDCLESMIEAEESWAMTPPPKRGDIVRQIGLKLRDNLTDFGALVSLEMGKIKSEGVGEVVEYIDMADLAAGMARQLPGQVLTSERFEHTMLETWNPLGKIGIISAFNFPCAVHGWNSCVSMIAGNTQIWKGSPTTSLVSIVQTRMMAEVLMDNNVHGGVATLCQGGQEIGKQIVEDPRLSLVSFTGSTAVGREVAGKVASRFGRSILELGGNNAIVVMDDADLDNAVPTILFAAAGTAGQRCTTGRRIIIHEKVYDKVKDALVAAYAQLKPGNPLDEKTLLGPLHSANGVAQFEKAIKDITAQGGKVLVGGKAVAKDNEILVKEGLTGGHYVHPTLVESTVDMPIVKEEIFVPISHLLKVSSYEEAVEIANSTDFGLSSAIFTKDMRNSFRWLGPQGSYAGIVNINTSCSGAEIGGAFGGEKNTGGGRESGSDAWKQYMRRSTCAINYGTSVPLAQGVDFSL